MSDLNSSICDKNRIILRNPDGTIMHCIKEDCCPSPLKPKMPTRDIDEIAISDDDLRHIIDISTETDYPFLIKQIISLFKNYINVYIIIKACEVFLSYYLIAELYFSKENSIRKIHYLFTCDYDKSKLTLYSLLALIAFCTTIYSVLSIVMIKIKNLKLIKVNSYLTLSLAVIDIPLSYFHL